jgi:anti-repressor protein
LRRKGEQKMEELMKVQVKNDRQLVSARDLHKGLGLKGRFSRWFKTNSELFTENEDFYKCTSSTVVNNGAVRELDDYLLTIEMAKQLAMMARTEKSKLYREYFLDLERKWNSPEMVMHRALEFSNARIKQLKLENKNLSIQLEESNKKVSYLDIILGTPDVLATTQIAADYGYSAVKFNQILHRLGIQHKVNSQWILYRVYMGKGYVTSKLFTYKDTKGRDRSKTTTYWTQKGRKLIYDVLRVDNILPLIERDDIA